MFVVLTPKLWFWGAEAGQTPIKTQDLQPKMKKLRAHLPEFGFWKPTPPQKMHVAEVDGSNMGVYGLQATHFVHQDRFFYKILGFRV